MTENLAGGSANRIDRIRPDAPELAAPGPYPVGVRTDELVNPDQIDIANVSGAEVPRYDRRLTVEIWYPAQAGTVPGTTYETLLRDGVTPIRLNGRAHRDAPVAEGRFPLVILSHGYPGNRFLLSHLGENLASKGYVVASIDHRESTYGEVGAFGITLVNRPLDTRFVMDALTGSHPLAANMDAANIAIIGYSMGAYGSLISGGVGVAAGSIALEGSPPNRLLERHLAGSASHEALIDPRVKAIVPIGPWGRQRGYFDAEGVAGLRKPALIIGGSADGISGYDTCIRKIFEEARGVDRCLLTFKDAGHNAAAPIPAPEESWFPSPALDFVPFQHYADKVWDTVRMNNVTQHFVTAFLGLHLKGDTSLARFLPAESTSEFVPGTPWPGFEPDSTLGLRLERRPKGA